MTEPSMPVDPGWEPADDGCKAIYGLLGWRCENDDPNHLDAGEPHTFTVSWFDPIAEPECEKCADTGQNAGQFCDCDAGKRLAGLNTSIESEMGAQHRAVGAQWIPDEDPE